VIVEMDYKAELQKLRKMLEEKILNILEGLQTGGREKYDW